MLGLKLFKKIKIEWAASINGKEFQSLDDQQK